MRAYDVQSFQVSGPSWMDRERFDVIAKVPGGTSREDVRVMLQNLLADRFRLKLHKETKEAPVYEMTVAKGGIRMKEAAPAEAARDSGPTLFTALQAQLGLKLTSRKGPVDRLVVERAEKMPGGN